MNRYLSRAALIWGLVCLSLLYNGLPSELILSWMMHTQQSVPLSHLLLNVATHLLPSLMPLFCFIIFTHSNLRKRFILSIPFVIWLASHFIIATVFYFSLVKSGNAPLYIEKLSTSLWRMIDIYWSLRTLSSAVVIIVCSYAFWREQFNKSSR